MVLVWLLFNCYSLTVRELIYVHALLVWHVWTCMFWACMHVHTPTFKIWTLPACAHGVGEGRGCRIRGHATFDLDCCWFRQVLHVPCMHVEVLRSRVLKCFSYPQHYIQLTQPIIYSHWAACHGCIFIQVVVMPLVISVACRCLVGTCFKPE